MLGFMAPYQPPPGSSIAAKPGNHLVIFELRVQNLAQTVRDCPCNAAEVEDSAGHHWTALPVGAPPNELLNAVFGGNMDPGAEAQTFFRAEVPNTATVGLQVVFPLFLAEPVRVAVS